MSVSVAVASAASANSAAAASRAREAEKIACQGYMPNYNAQTATVAEMRQYANCVDVLHPVELNAGTVLLFKVVIVFALVGMVAGGVKGLRELDDGMGLIVGGLMGAVLIGCIPLVAIGIYAGVAFLFS